jgi:hypothetical protein
LVSKQELHRTLELEKERARKELMETEVQEKQRIAEALKAAQLKIEELKT